MKENRRLRNQMNDRWIFKAKRKDNGEWVEGNLVWSDDADDDYKAIIIPTTGSNMFTRGGSNGDLGFEKWYRVDPSTICQCTGLKDKNGKLIWENDIVSFQFDNDDCPFPNKDTKKRIGKVFFSDFRASWSIAMGKNGSKSLNNDLWKYVQNGNRVEVIGSAIDNPELLGVGL